MSDRIINYPGAQDERPGVGERWSVAHAESMFHMHAWGAGFFGVNARGNVEVRVEGQDAPGIDLQTIATELRERGVPFPVLVRFQDVLSARVRQLNEAFRNATEAGDYGSHYIGVYPIKVNQLHEVVEEVLDAGRPYGMGLECGSKTELVAALPHLDDDTTLLICNGFKDNSMLQLILDAQRLRKNVIPVIEKEDEFLRMLTLADALGQRPRFGVRVRLTAAANGHWADSAGDYSKFGLSIPSLLNVVGELERRGCPDALELLHFHLGSQIADIVSLTEGIKELGQIYAQLQHRGVPIRYLDVGGGLGVNYSAGFGLSHDDGINYTLQEYANAVVHTVRDLCLAADVPPPVLISESGRALTAHHSVLLVEALDAYRQNVVAPGFALSADDHALVGDLVRTLARVNETPPSALRDLREAYHDATTTRREAESTFRLGYLAIEQKALCDRVYWEICERISAQLRHIDGRDLPLELAALESRLVDQYLCDFSVFQSMLDHWAIGQRFPIVPIQRLDERPDRRGVLVDLTCDSDGKIKRYVAPNPERSFLNVHSLRADEPYVFGFFMMGAYQDIMGDSHNLFGRVAEVHVYADRDEPDGYYIEKLIPGTTVEQMLAQVQYFPNDLERRMSALIRAKIAAKVIRPKEGIRLLDRYTQMFKDTTYYRPEHAKTQTSAEALVRSGDAPASARGTESGAG